jgi:hypothetical protein
MGAPYPLALVEGTTKHHQEIARGSYRWRSFFVLIYDLIYCRPLLKERQILFGIEVSSGVPVYIVGARLIEKVAEIDEISTSDSQPVHFTHLPY